MALTPQQIAALSGEDPSAYYRADIDRLAQARAGEIPAYSRGATTTAPQVAQFQLGEYTRGLKERGVRGYNDMIAKAPGAYEAAVKNARNAGLTSRNVGGAGAVLGGLGIVNQQFSQDQPVGGVAAIGGSIGGAMGFGALANAFTRGMPGIGGTILRTAAPIVGSLFGGNVAAGLAEYGKNVITGEQIGKKPETAKAGPPSYIPGTNIPLNESARMLALKGAVGQQDLEMYKQQTATDMAFNRQMIQYQLESDMQRMKSQMPYITKLKNDDLVRSQALLNTQGNVDARLGMLATQGALARGAQAEAGAFARTAISTNPYANAATRQSPNIQFG